MDVFLVDRLRLTGEIGGERRSRELQRLRPRLVRGAYGTATGDKNKMPYLECCLFENHEKLSEM